MVVQRICKISFIKEYVFNKINMQLYVSLVIENYSMV